MTTGQDQGVAVPLAGSTCAPIQKPVSLMGCGFASITEDEAFRRCLEWCKQPRRSRLVVPTNVSILMMMRRMPRLRNVCTSDDLVVADGTGDADNRVRGHVVLRHVAQHRVARDRTDTLSGAAYVTAERLLAPKRLIGENVNPVAW